MGGKVIEMVVEDYTFRWANGGQFVAVWEFGRAEEHVPDHMITVPSTFNRSQMTGGAVKAIASNWLEHGGPAEGAELDDAEVKRNPVSKLPNEPLSGLDLVEALSKIQNLCGGLEQVQFLVNGHILTQGDVAFLFAQNTVVLGRSQKLTLPGHQPGMRGGRG